MKTARIKKSSLLLQLFIAVLMVMASIHGITCSQITELFGL